MKSRFYILCLIGLFILCFSSVRVYANEKKVDVNVVVAPQEAGNNVNDNYLDLGNLRVFGEGGDQAAEIKETSFTENDVNPQSLGGGVGELASRRATNSFLLPIILIILIIVLIIIYLIFGRWKCKRSVLVRRKYIARKRLSLLTL